MNLSQALLKDTQRTDSSIEMLKYNVTSLEGAMKELVGVANLTLIDQQMVLSLLQSKIKPGQILS